jgi:hypothetical protein
MGRRFTKSERKRLHTQDKLSSVPTQSEVQSPFRVVQAQSETQQVDYPDLQTQLKTANQFGHKLADISTQAIGSAPSLSLIQPKLTIGAPGDKYEQEADRVAQQVVQQLSAPPAEPSSPNQTLQRENMPEEEELQMKPEPQLQRQESAEEEEEELQMKPEASLQRQESVEEEEEELQMKPEASLQRQEAAEEEDEELQMKPLLQRQENVGGGEAPTELETSIRQARGSGQTLNRDLQQRMGQAMRADFSGVRVHTDSKSDQLNRSIQAKAFTTKQDVFFRKGEYNPTSRSGQELIAHELTHVVQQNGGTVQRELLSQQQRSPSPATENPSTSVGEGVIQEKGEMTGNSQESSESDLSHKTGLPKHLKIGIENLSGYLMDDVKVHYNSEKPAQLQAQAYTQGTEIHVAPGQEKHLPHEAWHVVQQKQGRVKSTMQMKGKVNINDDAGLEKEADVMGAKAAQNIREVQKTRGETKGLMLSQKVVDPAEPIQMAGHAGVMIFGNAGKLFKRIENNEAAQFRKVMAMQGTEREAGHQNLTRGAFPRIYQVLSAAQLDAAQVRQQYGDGKKVREWLGKGKEEDHYVEMESVGGADVDVLDFKVGTATADPEELVDNYGKTEKQAAKKVAKMAKIDTTTETASYGLRDSDAAKASITDNLKRILRGKFVPTLTDITNRVKKDIDEGRGAYAADDQAIIDLNNIRDYITGADTVYIASSLVMQWNKDRAFKETDRVVLIDLAHPMDDEMGGFEEAKNGMLLGIANLKRILLGARPSLAPET